MTGVKTRGKHAQLYSTLQSMMDIRSTEPRRTDCVREEEGRGWDANVLWGGEAWRVGSEGALDDCSSASELVRLLFLLVLWVEGLFIILILSFNEHLSLFS